MFVPASITFSLFSLVLSFLVIFFIFFLFPLVKDYRIYSTVQVKKYEYISFHGRVIDLHRAVSPRLKGIHSKYKGRDISTLVPTFSQLGRPISPNAAYPDRDINTCVNDPLIADSWLMNLVEAINGTVILFNNGTLEKCMDPIAGTLTEDCITFPSDLREMFQRIVGVKQVERKVLDAGTRVMENSLVAIDNRVFDVTAYLSFATFYNVEEENRAGQLPSPRSGDTMFLHINITDFLLKHMGRAVSFAEFDQFTKLENPEVYLRCFRKLFFYGKLSPSPLADVTPHGNWILLTSSIVVAFFVLIKIISAWIYPLYVPSYLKACSSSFILCVPLFNEPPSVIQGCLNRILASQLPGGKSLLFVMCDGNVQSQGDIKEVHRVVLDHLNHPWYQCPGEVIDLPSLGEGEKGKNRGRIFFGTYADAHGCHMPYIVLAKVGGPLEPYVSKPGNRGKRDSLYLVLRFISSVLNTGAGPLSALDLTILRTFQNVHIEPASIEYLISIDGDLLVEPRAVYKLVQQMMLEPELSACCGTLKVEHAFASIPTMLESFHIFWTTHVLRSFEAVTLFQAHFNTALACYRVQARPNNTFCSSPHSPHPNEVPNGPLWAAHPTVVSKLGTKSLTSLLTKNLYLLGEDVMLASILQELHPASKLRFLPSAMATVQLPASFLNLLLRLKREWIIHLFASISVLYRPTSVFHRMYAVCCVFWKLTSPVILGTGYAMLVFATSPLVTYALLVWAGVAALFVVGLFFAQRFDIVFQFILHVTLGLPLHMVVVPILGLLEIASVKWVDQWSQAHGAPSLQRPPGAKWDPVLEKLSSSGKPATPSPFPDHFSELAQADSNQATSSPYLDDPFPGPELRQRKPSRGFDAHAAQESTASAPYSDPPVILAGGGSPHPEIVDMYTRTSRPESSATVLSTSGNGHY